jgi:hypothetical protein
LDDDFGGGRMKQLDLYADNMRVLTENLIAVGGHPLLAFDRYNELVKTLSLNGIRIQLKIEVLK